MTEFTIQKLWIKWYHIISNVMEASHKLSDWVLPLVSCLLPIRNQYRSISRTQIFIHSWFWTSAYRFLSGYIVQFANIEFRRNFFLWCNTRQSNIFQIEIIPDLINRKLWIIILSLASLLSLFVCHLSWAVRMMEQSEELNLETKCIERCPTLFCKVKNPNG